MDSKGDSRKVDEEGSKEVFRRELDKWFREKGVMADLRSHLRHSMVMALQDGWLGRGPKDDGSPKVQALDLLVADFLSSRECHYTLSVFTSEVPRLTRFVPGLSASTCRERTQRRTTAPDKRNFRKKEVEEIFNALGFSVWPSECERLTKNYLKDLQENSLLEFILRWATEIATKLDIRQNLESQETLSDEDSEEIRLSSRWTSDVVNVLARERIKSVQAVSIKKSISRITEAEFRRLKEEERRKSVQVLAERERRIQKLLIRYENEIRLKLNGAEREFMERKNSIEKGLMERQKHLSKMIRDWTAKHEEIVHLAKIFYNWRKEERKKMEKTMETMKKDDETLVERNDDMKILREEVDWLRQENDILRKRLNFSGENEEEKPEVLTDGLCWQPSFGDSENEKNKSIVEAKENGCDKESHQEENDEEVSQVFSDKILLNFRKKLKSLEESATLINQEYLKYKTKYATVCVSEFEGDCESSNHSSNDLQPSELLRSGRPFFNPTKCSQTEGKENHFVIWENQNQRDEFPSRMTSDNLISEKSSFVDRDRVKFPTKRQLINREYFLESRKLLEELEMNNKRDEVRMGFEFSSSESVGMREDDTSSSENLSNT